MLMYYFKSIVATKILLVIGFDASTSDHTMP